MTGPKSELGELPVALTLSRFREPLLSTHRPTGTATREGAAHPSIHPSTHRPGQRAVSSFGAWGVSLIRELRDEPVGASVSGS